MVKKRKRSAYRVFIRQRFHAHVGFYPEDPKRPRLSDAEYARVCSLCKREYSNLKKFHEKTKQQPRKSWQPKKPGRSWQGCKAQWKRHWAKKQKQEVD